MLASSASPSRPPSRAKPKRVDATERAMAGGAAPGAHPGVRSAVDWAVVSEAEWAPRGRPGRDRARLSPRFPAPRRSWCRLLYWAYYSKRHLQKQSFPAGP
jgi:hypothetical protein